jgi:lipopolysaccharide heptosyltransferase I
MRILAIKMSSLGDLFHVLPALHNLVVRMDAKVDWVVNSEYEELVKCFTDVEQVIPFPRHDLVGNFFSFVKELRSREYDMAIDFQGLLKSAMVARLARADVRLGPSFHREGSRLFYSAVAGRRNKNRHAIDENCDVVDFLKQTRIPPEFPMKFPDKPIHTPRPRVALLPSARWPSKRWPATGFAETGRRLQSLKKVSIYLVGGADGMPECAQIERELNGKVTNLAGRTALPELGAILKQMDLVIANDTGPIHMSAAMGIRTLVVFGPTDPRRTGPYGEGNRVVRAVQPCQPCFSRTCRKEGIPCLSGVTPEHVAEVAMEMLGRPAGAG